MRKPDEARRRGRRLRVLLAEDAPENRRYIAHLLRRAEVDLVCVEDGRAAVDCIAEGFDVVLMDMQMPVMDGYDATRALRGAGHAVPIVALTAHDGDAERAKCISAGCTRFLTKPVGRSQLQDLLFELCPPRGEELGEREGDAELFDDPEFLAIVSDFVRELGARVLELEASLEAADWCRLESLAHRLKGAAGSLGLDAVSEASSEIESLAASTREAAACAASIARLSALVAGLEPDPS